MPVSYPWWIPLSGKSRVTSAMLAALLVVAGGAAAFADTLTPKQAIRAITQAGFAGVGGVTHDRNFYYAAAVDAKNKRKRVRVTLDDQTGKIVAVVPLARGGAALVNPPSTSNAAIPRVDAAPQPRMAYPPYQAPNPSHPVGQVQYPFNTLGTRLQPGYCQFRRNANAPGC